MAKIQVTGVLERDLSKYLDLAVAAAHSAGKIINEMRLTAQSYEKLDGSIVTDADRAAEKHLRKIFQEHTPEASIWGEEFGRAEAVSEIEWIIDPIDGTIWYEMGSPIFGTLIALVVAGQPVVGVIAMPATQETVFASQGHGCFYSNPLLSTPQRISVSQSVTCIKDARISSAGLHRSDIWPEKGRKAYSLSRLPDSAKLFRFAGDHLQHALVARGKLDGAIDTAMHAWDNAAIIPCIVEAGGIVSGIEGQTENVIECGSLLSASSNVLLEELVDVLAPGRYEVSPLTQSSGS